MTIRKIRLRADSALHVSGSELVVVAGHVGVHAMNAIVEAHALDLIEKGLAEPVIDTPASADEALLPEVVPAAEEPLEPASFFC